MHSSRFGRCALITKHRVTLTSALKGVSGHKWAKDQEERFEKGGSFSCVKAGFYSPGYFMGFKSNGKLMPYVGDSSCREAR